MTTELLSATEVDFANSRRALLLVWQNPESRKFIKVGQLDVLSDGRFAFRYLPGVSSDGVTITLVDYPERDAVYVSDQLPAFFSNRVMSSERPSFRQYIDWLGVADLQDAELPIELLARTGGGRVTDTFHVVDMPIKASKNFSSRFFVSGLRHVSPAEEILSGVKPGDELLVRLEKSNAVNPKAVMLDARDGSAIGYVPDWLCEDVHDLIVDGWSVTAVAERINLDAPAHVRVLCRLDASRY